MPGSGSELLGKICYSMPHDYHFRVPNIDQMVRRYRTRQVVFALSLLLPQLIARPAYAALVPGLLETQVNAANDFVSQGDPVLGSDVVLSALMSELSNVQTGKPAFPTVQHIWTENDTWIYTGQIFFSNHNGNGTATYSFAENINDSTLLTLDGVTHIADTSVTPVGTGPITLPTGFGRRRWETTLRSTSWIGMARLNTRR